MRKLTQDQVLARLTVEEACWQLLEYIKQCQCDVRMRVPQSGTRPVPPEYQAGHDSRCPSAAGQSQVTPRQLWRILNTARTTVIDLTEDNARADA